MNKLALLAIAVVSTCVNSAESNSWSSLQGLQKIEAESLSDPVPHAPLVVYFSIRGRSARSIYERLPLSGRIANVCDEAGMSAKSAGNMMCFRKASRYSCEYGIRLSDGALVNGRTC